ncbi:MAG: hypothetical protein KGZ37_10475 [Nitrosarchaeum sp.]|nr:hypothetical protein [Nitrosarchaeum sp.]
MSSLKEAWEIQLLTQYQKKGLFARRGLIQIFLDEINHNLQKKNRTDTYDKFGLDDNEVVGILQIGLIAHIMMFIEDLAIICTSIKDGTIEYYKFLDAEGDKELGKTIKKFFDSVNTLTEDDVLKILSYDTSSFNFKSKEEKDILEEIIKKNVEKTQNFLKRLAIFTHNHHKIFRRYKHAGFPIITNVKIPEDIQDYKTYNFMSIAFTSKEELTKEIATLPFSKSVLETYGVLKQDIFEFLGTISMNKSISLIKKINGILPHEYSVFRKILTDSEKHILNDIWKRIEEQYPNVIDNEKLGTNVNSEFMEWYVNLNKYTKSSFES